MEEAVYCVIKGTIPAGVSVPMHSHPDDESFYLLSGTIQVLTPRGDTFEWQDVRVGEFAHFAAGIKHAWRNVSREDSVSLITTTARLGKFFREVGRPVSEREPLPHSPTAEELEHFAQVAARYGHWLSTPQENAAVGISLLR